MQNLEAHRLQDVDSAEEEPWTIHEREPSCCHEEGRGERNPHDSVEHKHLIGQIYEECVPEELGRCRLETDHEICNQAVAHTNNTSL